MIDGDSGTRAVTDASRVLPESAQLELVRAAALRSAEDRGESVRLTDVEWFEPVVVLPDRGVRVGLRPGSEGQGGWSVLAGSGATGSGGRATSVAEPGAAPLGGADAGEGTIERVSVDLAGSLVGGDALPGSLDACLAALCARYGGEERRPRLRSEEHTSELQSRFDLVCR